MQGLPNRAAVIRTYRQRSPRCYVAKDGLGDSALMAWDFLKQGDHSLTVLLWRQVAGRKPSEIPHYKYASGTAIVWAILSCHTGVGRF